MNIEINHGKGIKNNGLIAIIKKGFLFDLELSGSSINLQREENETKIKGTCKEYLKSDQVPTFRLMKYLFCNPIFIKTNSSRGLVTRKDPLRKKIKY